MTEYLDHRKNVGYLNTLKKLDRPFKTYCFDDEKEKSNNLKIYEVLPGSKDSSPGAD